MQIAIDYTIYTDCDFSLKSPEKFGCIAQDVDIGEEHYDYLGRMIFEDADETKCRKAAKKFLEQFQYECLHLDSGSVLAADFDEVFSDLKKFVEVYSGKECWLIKHLYGDYEPTEIRVSIKNSEAIEKMQEF